MNAVSTIAMSDRCSAIAADDALRRLSPLPVETAVQSRPEAIPEYAFKSVYKIYGGLADGVGHLLVGSIKHKSGQPLFVA